MQRNRKVGRHHLAFYRGWLQGIDLRDLADRYLETGLDLRLAKATLAWLRDTLSQAALRQGKRGEARLLRLHLATGQAPAIPSLEEFREENDPDGFYREEELIRLYLERYPQAADRKIRQRQRLIERQLKALDVLERLLATEPVPADPVSAWFDKPVADRLVLADIPTIGTLLDRIRDRGYRWWITVPKLGEKGAARIVAWLRGYESSLGPLPDHATAPVRSLQTPLLVQARDRETAIVPIEAFAVPQRLSGETGSNRHPGPPRIQANNDHQAIESWLATKSGSPHTARAYRKEAERLLLWAVIERQKALSDLTVEDCAAYRDWLSLLGRVSPEQWPFRIAQSEWIGKRNTPRFSPNWRPFDGPLSATSVRQALTILSGLFEWLVRVQYCAFNPWDAVGRKPAVSPDAPEDVELTRVFSTGQWDYLMAFLDTLPADEAASRLRFTLPFAQASGLRLSELVDASVGRLYTMPLKDGLGVRWMLKVLGKGGKWRAVPMPSRVMDRLREYLARRGLDPDPLANPPETPLISRLGSQEPMTGSALYKTLRTVFHQAAESLAADGKDQEAKAFRRATVHWLRHTCGAHLASSGVPVNLVQKLLGHASLATTSIYTETDDEQLWSELESRV
ncbi:tyrosine-type recombinase/integrase [Pelomicrobium methylotrophicum]|uniref:Tyrosine-type recombinase/integrase n=1 Tax=Pelomicrobium methylotrophicum TaxID=2602750 RepID=A0A5C7EJL6_9PROT|nr:tyrosine-type recombinase/integrase [Pelomicrobium methylotrophicum]TXF11178.1 tyrosine-type recombinase/integrase [Pelomicrobium methylotrophicum]